MKYGIRVPNTVAEAKELDAANGNTLWMDAIRTEIVSLIGLNCFEFHSPCFKPPEDYSWTTLHFNFEVKPDLCRKA